MKFHMLTLDLYLVFVKRYIKLMWALLNLILFDFNHIFYQSCPDFLSKLSYFLIYMLQLLLFCQLQIYDSYYIVIQAIAE